MSAPAAYGEPVTEAVASPLADLPARPPALSPESAHRGFVAVSDRGGILLPVGSVTTVEARAWADADWWSRNDVPGAFVCELREVTR